MDFFSFVVGSISTALLIGALLFLSKIWIESRIASSVKHEYDIKLREHERQNEIRTRAELISELMAEWISTEVDYKRLNQLSFQAFLWLPDALAVDLSNTLSHKANAKNLRQIIVGARKHLLGAEDSFNPISVIVFSPKSCVEESIKAEPVVPAV